MNGFQLIGFMSYFEQCSPIELTKATDFSQVTLVSWIVEHIEISEHLAKFAEKLLVEHLFYTISIATNKRTPSTFLSLRK